MSFAFTGKQRSYSFGCFHADAIPNSLTAVRCPALYCEWVQCINREDSTGNVLLGSSRLAVVGNGKVLVPGETSGWIPVNNLNLIWHKETDATTYLTYIVIGCSTARDAESVITAFYLLQEAGDHLVQENEGKIILE